MLSIFSLLLSSAFAIDLTHLAPTGPMNCDQARLIYVEMRGEFSKKEEVAFCFDKEFIHIVSKSCEKNCELANRAKADIAPLVYKTQGQPGSWLCQSYGGKARVMFLEYQGRRHKQSFCLLGKDVVSTPYLLSLKSKGHIHK